MYLRGPMHPVAAAFGPDSRTIFTQEIGGLRRYRCVVCGTISELRELAEQRIAQAGRVPTAEEQDSLLR